MPNMPTSREDPGEWTQAIEATASEARGGHRLCRRRWSSRTVVGLALFGVMQLGGCEGLTPQLKLRDIDGQHSVIRFEDPNFQPELAEYAVQDDPQTGNEFYTATFNGPETSGALAAMVTGPSYVVEEIRTKSVVPDLIAKDADIVWGESGGAVTGLGYTRYRFFRIANEALSCVGFAQTTSEQSSDARGGKGAAVYGYFCRDESDPMTADFAKELLAHVKLSPGAGR